MRRTVGAFSEILACFPSHSWRLANARQEGSCQGGAGEQGALPSGGRGRSSPCPAWGTAPMGWEEERSEEGKEKTNAAPGTRSAGPSPSLVSLPWDHRCPSLLGAHSSSPLLTSPGFVSIQQESGSREELSPPELLPCLEGAGFTLLGLAHAGWGFWASRAGCDFPGSSAAPCAAEGGVLWDPSCPGVG